MQESSLLKMRATKIDKIDTSNLKMQTMSF